jgi:hypothetical protein
MVNVRRRELHLDYFTHTHTHTHAHVCVCRVSCTIRILVGNIKKYSTTTTKSYKTPSSLLAVYSMNVVYLNK